MLKRLEIQNYAIIESLDLRLENGLTIITGETGAGKSILLGALGLIMGNRADSRVLYQTDQKCYVEATFDISEYNLQDFFKKEELEYEEELIIRRVINTSGKSRAFINDEPTTLSILKELTEQLVDLHQQFDTLDLHSVSFQTKTIDAIAGNLEIVEAYNEEYRHFQKIKRQLNVLVEEHKQANQEMDFLSFQMNEFNEAELMNGEKEEKEQLLEKLSNAEDIQRVGTMIYHRIEDGEMTVNDTLTDLGNELSSFASADKELESLYERLISAQEELRDLALAAQRIADNTEFDEGHIEELKQRLDLIYRLEKKHHVGSLEELLEVQDDIARRLDSFGDLSENIAKLEKEISKVEKSLIDKAVVIRKSREKAIPEFEKAIHEMLVPLSMENAFVKVEMEALDSPGPSGMDKITFLFSPNKGSSYKPLKDIASGGEISRLTLCIKSLIADAMTLPTLIFDEIDTGVSGEVASRMGEILSKLSDGHQIISITHSPQIAAKADKHYFVHKHDKEDRTVTAVKLLQKEERIIEIAKMLSGNPPSDAAIANAKDLLS